MALQLIYVLCGLAMASFYLPQILACANDQTGLAAYSLSKGSAQLACRALMLPFVWVTVDSPTMLAIQSIDVALRAVEVACALGSLKRQGIDWRTALRADTARSPSRSGRVPQASPWRLSAGPMNAVWRHARQGTRGIAGVGSRSVLAASTPTPSKVSKKGPAKGDASRPPRSSWAQSERIGNRS